ncbi:thioredoxin domain-containing protein [Haloferula sargassicola]|uniref:Spermatogenesis-associated protein 20-like TRX domain-containing protein n=1 Tax=Haloferula sargassicola TaxID=490096 RepID=A0ABP9UP03_9BACT
MPNALADETSPYLLQHQDNPVNWVPWGEAAFLQARETDKPVFLSIGYSTCHWCHVMERESFENEAIAAVMNEGFVCVKVDREERPDVDAAFMAFVQATTGQGGWPMSVWLTPDGEPIVGGTYFPPDDRHGRPGFPRLCREIARLWKEDRVKMKEAAERVAEHMQQPTTADAVVRGLPDAKVFGDFIDRCESMFDPDWGGWGGAPKFPRPSVPRVLLQLSDRFGADSDEGGSCLQMVERTLDLMAAGGMHDQVGGGFHRYSVDRYWHVPHYEKMLYDQAQLLHLYLDACQATGEARYARVASGIVDYVLRDLRDPAGGFHAAEDADSIDPEGEKKEGAYWTWTADDLQSLLSPEDAALACAAWGVELEGNARPESDPHGELEGRNTLFRAMGDSRLRETFGEDAVARLEEIRQRLLEVREKRTLPHRDDKIITAWNGLMIGALARAGQVLDRGEAGKAAMEAAGFLKAELFEDGKLFRSWRQRSSGVDAFPADYAFLIEGLLHLHGIDDGGWLEWAVELQGIFDRECWSEERIGYVMRPTLSGKELMSIREDHDGAEPSPNHVAAVNLLKLEALTGEAGFGKKAEALLRAGSLVIEKHGFYGPVLLGALDLRLRGVRKLSLGRTADVSALRMAYEPRGVQEKVDGTEVTVCEGESCRLWDAG